MEKKPPEPMTPFDELITSPALQAVKLLIPYTPESGRQILAAFVKLQELRQALRLFGQPQNGICAQSLGKPSSIFDILINLKPYLSHRDADMVDMLVNLKEMMETIEIMKKSADASDGEDNISPLDLITSILTPEQQEAFQMYSSMFAQPPDEIRKGDEHSERVDEQSSDTGNGSGETGTD